jgi:hypothetical protein
MNMDQQEKKLFMFSNKLVEDLSTPQTRINTL